MKKTILTMAALAAVLWLQAGSAKAQTSAAQTGQKVKPKPTITYEAYQVDSLGYGYKIKLDNKYVIIQPHIPGIEGIVRFESETDALKTAKHVAFKIDRDIFPPAIYKRELDSLKIRKR